MSDMKEKLVELLTDCEAKGFWSYGTDSKTGEHGGHEMTAEDIADYLVENIGSKWISVKDQEEPTENGTYLCHGYWFGSRREQTETAEFFGEWNIANNFILTHWMPLPQPPKGE